MCVLHAEIDTAYIHQTACAQVSRSAYQHTMKYKRGDTEARSAYLCQRTVKYKRGDTEAYGPRSILLECVLLHVFISQFQIHVKPIPLSLIM